MTAHRPCVRLLVCGTADRGDDGAAIAAVARLLPALPDRLRSHLEVRRVGQLDPLDLLGAGGCVATALPVVLDTVVGVDPGSIVVLPLATLAGHGAGNGGPPTGPTARSTHTLPIRDVIALAEAVGGQAVVGTFIGIGGQWFGYGTRFSRAVKAALPAFEAAILFELERLVGGGDGGAIDEPLVTVGDAST